MHTLWQEEGRTVRGGRCCGRPPTPFRSVFFLRLRAVESKEAVLSEPIVALGARSRISSSVQLYYKRRASPENTTSRPPQSDERVVAHLETEAGDRAELLLVLRPEDRREGRRVVPVSELAVEAARHAERRRVALGAVLERKRRPATSAPPAITGRAEAAAAGAYFCSGPNWAGRTGGSGIGSDSKDGMSVSSLRYSAELCIFVVTSTLEKRWAGGGGGGERQQRERTVVAGRTPCLT